MEPIRREEERTTQSGHTPAEVLSAAAAAAGEMAAVARMAAGKAGEVGVDAREAAEEKEEEEEEEEEEGSVEVRGAAVGPEEKERLYQRLVDDLAQRQRTDGLRQAAIQGVGVASNASALEGASC